MTANPENSDVNLDWNLLKNTCFCGSAAQRIFLQKYVLVLQFYIKNRFHNTVFGPWFPKLKLKFPQKSAQNPSFFFLQLNCRFFSSTV